MLKDVCKNLIKIQREITLGLQRKADTTITTCCMSEGWMSFLGFNSYIWYCVSTPHTAICDFFSQWAYRPVRTGNTILLCQYHHLLPRYKDTNTTLVGGGNKFLTHTNTLVKIVPESYHPVNTLRQSVILTLELQVCKKYKWPGANWMSIHGLWPEVQRANVYNK